MFASWCAPRSATAIAAVPATVAVFLADEAGRGFGPVTIARRAASDRRPRTVAHNEPDPCDSGAGAAVMAGIRRGRGTRPMRKAKPLELDPLARLREPIDKPTPA